MLAVAIDTLKQPLSPASTLARRRAQDGKQRGLGG